MLAAVAAAAPDEPIVLVPHSNAGLYAPHLTDQLEVRTTVYVDAALPEVAAEGRTTPLAPAAFLEFVEGLAGSDRVLPPWTQWWDDITGLFPDEAALERVRAEEPRVPLAYFTSQVPVPSGWAQRPAAYLAFGDTYDDERHLAERAGWPVRTLVGGHLHLLHDPAAVGAAIVGLASQARAG